MKRYDAFDVFKLIAAICICAIHSMSVSWGNVLFPLSRICVPVFFMISSYLFFARTGSSQKSGWANWISFMIRNAKLYLFWFVVLSPLIISSMDFSNGAIYALIELTGKAVLGSTFAASWFIPALVIDVGIVLLMSKKLGHRNLAVLYGSVYMVCCLVSNYRGLFSTDGGFLGLFVYTYPGTIYNSFPVGLLWVYLGKCFAEDRIAMPESKNKLALLLCVGLLYIEYGIIRKLGCSVENDCYFMLLPVCVVMFDCLRKAKIQINHAKHYRNASTIIYCLHGSLILVCRRIIQNQNLVLSSQILDLFVFLIVLGICLLVSVVIVNLSKRKSLRILKSAY